ncbi:MAG TPA: hypothetical protein VGL99_06565 [Chloroflexota bacterium]|jgi:hypothetical protein
MHDTDDIDRLFARLERANVPDTLTARVLAQTVGKTRARTTLAWPWLVAGLGALTLLTMTGYLLGASLEASDGLDLLVALFGDLGLVLTAPGEVVAVVGDVVPWGLVGVAGVSAAFLVWAVGNVVSRAPAPGRQAA